MIAELVDLASKWPEGTVVERRLDWLKVRRGYRLIASLRRYHRAMSGTSMRVDARGRVVIPAHLRQLWNWSEGTTLVCVESGEGLVLYDRDELERKVRA